MPSGDTVLFSFDYKITLWFLGGRLRWPNDLQQFPFIKLGKPQVISTTLARVAGGILLPGHPNIYI